MEKGCFRNSDEIFRAYSGATNIGARSAATLPATSTPRRGNREAEAIGAPVGAAAPFFPSPLMDSVTKSSSLVTICGDGESIITVGDHDDDDDEDDDDESDDVFHEHNGITTTTTRGAVTPMTPITSLSLTKHPYFKQLLSFSTPCGIDDPALE